jgi:hypothetical protein
MNFPFAKMLSLAASLSLHQANKRDRIRRVVFAIVPAGGGSAANC